jgi:polysaccharide export outer membrane protein
MKQIFSIFQSNRINFSGLALLLLLALGGCVTNKEATYLQEYDQSMYSGEIVPPENYTIKANDNLYIRVTSPDPERARMFNSMGEEGILRADEATSQIMSYPVELDGTVDLPYVGSVHVVGKTLPEAKIAIAEVLDEYIKDAAITIKLVNNYVSILGEVERPGLYLIYKERLNIYQALSLAGDVADFGDRYTLAIIRKNDEGSTIKEFDITDRSIIDSEYYYVMPNDVLYVKPIKGRYFAINTAPWTFALSTLTAAISLIILIQNNVFLRNQ